MSWTKLERYIGEGSACPMYGLTFKARINVKFDAASNTILVRVSTTSTKKKWLVTDRL
jgi:hypothetical protein